MVEGELKDGDCTLVIIGEGRKEDEAVRKRLSRYRERSNEE